LSFEFVWIWLYFPGSPSSLKQNPYSVDYWDLCVLVDSFQSLADTDFLKA